MSFREKTCPYCSNTKCQAEWCGVEVGLIQVGPYHCQSCKAMELGPYDKPGATQAELALGWYAPEHVPETVSSINGVVVSAADALALYRCGLVDEVPFKIDADASRLHSLSSIVSVAR